MARKKERRQFLRKDCLMLCRCEGKGFRFDGHIVDISYGGAGIVGTKKLPAEGAELAVSILLAGSSINLPSRVVWVASKGSKQGLADFGVEFLDSLSERQEKLARFLPNTNTVEG
jgi:c-di-GMP-binding flagellar brake protein YcgR